MLVRVRAAAVNIGNWHVLRGIPYAMRPAVGLFKPKHEIPGLDLAGQVEAVGGSVKQFQPGDEVFGWCNGAFAEYACAEENNLLAKPSNLTLEQAAAVGDSAFTALNAVRDQGKVQPGQRVVINGASGGVGTFAVQIAKSFGADVTGVCSTKNAGDGPIDWREPSHRLHEGRLRSSGPALRRDARLGREPFAFGLHAGR